GGRERGMPEELLDDAQIGPALEEMGRSAVAQSVGAEVRRVLDVLEHAVHHLPDLALIDPTSASTEEEGRAAAGAGQLWPPDAQPLLEGLSGGQAVGHPALLVPLADDP